MNRTYLKFRFYLLVSSRAYWPLVAVFFLSLPNTDLSQVSIYVTVGLIAKFLFEIPSWYLWDRVWHKKTLVLAQLFLWIGAILFGLSTSLAWFIIASLAMALGQSLSSWTSEAYYYELLEEEWKENDFGKIWSQLKWSTGIISILFFVWYPLIWEISMTLPFIVAWSLNFIWMIVAITFRKPTVQHAINEWHKSIGEIIEKQRWTGTFFIILIFWLIWWTYLAELNFREPFIVEQWAALVRIWIMIGFSRFLMRVFSHTIVKTLYKYPLKKVMIINLTVLSIGYILISFSMTYYRTVLIASIYIGYWQSTRGIITKFLIDTLKDKRYKATILSLYWQTKDILWAILVLGVWYLMNIDYSNGFLMTGLVLFIVCMFIILCYPSKIIDSKKKIS